MTKQKETLVTFYDVKEERCVTKVSTSTTLDCVASISSGRITREY